MQFLPIGNFLINLATIAYVQFGQSADGQLAIDINFIGGAEPLSLHGAQAQAFKDVFTPKQVQPVVTSGMSLVRGQ